MKDEDFENDAEQTDAMDSDTQHQVSELLLGELTAAIAADSHTALDALPVPLADRAALVGEAMVRAQRSSVPTKVLPVPHAQSRARTAVLWSGWLTAAATLAVFAGVSRSSSGTSAEAGARLSPIAPAEAVAVGSPDVAGRRGAFSPEMLRDSLVTNDSSLLRLNWLATDDRSAVGAVGDVMWSARAQRGVMRIAGLAANDPTRWQYQLWIFDRSRDERYPVDGGVFDIPDGESDVLISIDPAIAVGDATLFAVTVEPAGGVVVSTRERIVLTAGL